MISIKATGRFQLITMLLKILPLLAIIIAGFLLGETENLPPRNPGNISVFEALATASIAAMWAFSGIEAGATPAGNIQNAKHTVPRAIFFAVVSVGLIYIAAMFAVMRLVPYETLKDSVSPFAVAATVFGPSGPQLIAIGAMVAIAGSLNGIILVTGQMPMAMAVNKLAPASFAKVSQSGSPRFSLLICGILGSLLLLMNFSGAGRLGEILYFMNFSSGGLLQIFETLLTMSMFMYLLPLFVSCLAEMKHSLQAKNLGVFLALLAAAYSVFTIFGAGIASMLWGSLLLLIGLCFYVLIKSTRTKADES